MRLLLDTHVFLWYINGESRLSPIAKDAIRDSANEVFLSVVSLCEIIVKHQLGKLPLQYPPETYLPEQREKHLISNLNLDEASVKRLVNLPSLHRDPFDRMLICQAIEHDLTIITVDSNISAYPVTVL